MTCSDSARATAAAGAALLSIPAKGLVMPSTLRALVRAVPSAEELVVKALRSLQGRKY